ncbi:MAG: type III pantothenate kinase [Rhodocyclales bacterium GT-UBC]|nr:MAG: type III pantothenate kinase [Rhodocyclales bacterium GT-UBC]
MILCIDSGNSRIKWGLHDGNAWVAQGAVAQGGAADLVCQWRDWPVPHQAVLANVAGSPVEREIASVLAELSVPLQIVQSSSNAGGVVNHYLEPSRLGVDRWCALIGAWALFGKACVVVMAGTATTIDTLDAQGHFLGGRILPGLDLMRRALARDTAALPFAAGTYVDFPRRTEDAIASGCLDAQAGAIERIWHRCRAEKPLCVLSGGNAELVGNQLVIPYRVAHNLPLEGLKRLASQS